MFSLPHCCAIIARLLPRQLRLRLGVGDHPRGFHSVLRRGDVRHQFVLHTAVPAAHRLGALDLCGYSECNVKRWEITLVCRIPPTSSSAPPALGGGSLEFRTNGFPVGVNTLLSAYLMRDQPRRPVASALLVLHPANPTRIPRNALPREWSVGWMGIGPFVSHGF